MDGALRGTYIIKMTYKVMGRYPRIRLKRLLTFFANCIRKDLLLPQMKSTKKIFFVLNWLGSFVGGQSSPEALAIVDRFLARGGLDADLRLKVLEVKDELERAVRIQAKYGQ